MKRTSESICATERAYRIALIYDKVSETSLTDLIADLLIMAEIDGYVTDASKLANDALRHARAEIDGDDYADDIEILNLAEWDGIPVAELMAAYEWRESLRGAGILDEIENHVVRCYQNMGG